MGTQSIFGQAQRRQKETISTVSDAIKDQETHKKILQAVANKLRGVGRIVQIFIKSRSYIVTRDLNL